MNSLVETALSNLIPRHNGPLPQELRDLTNSLLAQSRVKASSLRQEEESSRIYVCANIACERLKTSLNLPKIEPRPSLPPRIYTRLYNHFDNLLSTTSRSTANTPRSKSKTTSTSTSTATPQSHKRNLQSTPSRKTTTVTEDGSPTIKRARTMPTLHTTVPIRTPRSSLKYKTAAEKSAAVPPWIAPCVRLMCRKLHTRRAIPHVLAGVETVLTMPTPGPRPGEDGDGDGDDEADEGRGTRMMKGKEKIPALVAAIWFFVTTRLRGTATDGKAYTRERKAVLDVLGKQIRDDEWVLERVGGRSSASATAGALSKEGKGKGKSEDQDEEKNWHGWEPIGPKDVDAWLLEINSSGWLTLDWFTNIEEGSAGQDLDGGGKDELLEGEEDGEGNEDGGFKDEDVLSGGLGTMINDRIHCLTEAKRREYAIWKEKIMARIEEIEGEQQQQLQDEGMEMDVSEG
ncbi:origin recognition complex subunit 6-domain-containing protein [Xylogone sp. PMI_703]|nr:origin recognition complex subunit 6-domain-containing protein [Xylogone sp. PMI_703]